MKARETETKYRGQKIELKAEASDFCLEESFKSSLLHVVLIEANKLSTTAEGVVFLKRLEAKLTNACDFSTPWSNACPIFLRVCSVASAVSDFLQPHGLWPNQAPLSMEISRQGYWSGLAFPTPGDLPHPGIKPTSLTSPALTGGFFTTSTTWEAQTVTKLCTSKSWMCSLISFCCVSKVMKKKNFSGCEVRMPGEWSTRELLPERRNFADRLQVFAMPAWKDLVTTTNHWLLCAFHFFLFLNGNWVEVYHCHDILGLREGR